MFTLLSDAMSAATLARRGSNIPDHLKDYADRHVPHVDRSAQRRPHPQNRYRDLW